MSYAAPRIIALIAIVSLLASLIAGCSDDECPTCPVGGSGGANLTVQIMHPRPEPDYYYCAWAAGPDDLFIGTASGAVLRRQGTAWSRYETAAGLNVEGIWGASANDVFAVGGLGQISHINGNSLSTMYSGVLHQLNAVWGTAPDTVYAVGDNAIVLRYDGTAWNAVTTGLPADNRQLFDIWGSAADDIWAVGSNWSGANPGLLWHHDGSNWTESGLPSPIYSIWGTAPDTVFVGDDQARIWQYDGAVWNDHGVRLGDYIYSIWGTSASDVWAGGYIWDNMAGKSVGFASHYDGNTWNIAADSLITDPVQGISGVDASEVYFVGDNGMLVQWDGTEMMSLNDVKVTTEELQGVWGSSNDDLWGFGRRGAVIHFNGTDWADSTRVTNETLLAAWGSAPDNVYAVGEMGIMIHYDGSSWSEVAHGFPHARLESIWGTASDDIWVSADPGKMLYHGASGWQLRDVWSPAYYTARSLWGSAPNDYYAVVSNGVLHYGGSSWNVVPFAGYNIVAVHGVSANEVYFLAGGAGPAFSAEKSGAKKAGRLPTGGTLLRYDGSSYVVVAKDINAELLDVWALGSNNVFMSGNKDGRPAIAHYNGSGVSVKGTDATSYCRGLWGTGSNTAFAVGSMGMVIRATTN